MSKNGASSTQKGDDVVIGMRAFLEALEAGRGTELLGGHPETGIILDKLVGLGCCRQGLIGETGRYACFLMVQDFSRQRGVRSSQQRVGWGGYCYSRVELKELVKSCKSLSKALGIFNSTRMDTEELRNRARGFLQVSALLCQQADFIIEVGKVHDRYHEANKSKLSTLVSLIQYLKDRTGAPQFASVVVLLEGMRKVFPFTSEISEDLLRKQYVRAKSIHRLSHPANEPKISR